MVGQARIELTVSVFSKRMGDHTLLSHMAAGSPAGGLCLLSAEIRIERKKRQWLIAVEVGAGFEPTASCCAASVLPQAPTDHLRAGLVSPGTPQIPASFALVPQGGIEPHYVTGAAALSQPIPRPLHRAAAYLRVPSVRLSSVTDFRFATAFSPCGGAGLSRLSSCRFRVCFNTEDERLPRVRIPIRFRGVSRASTLWAYLWARMRSVRAVAL